MNHASTLSNVYAHATASGQQVVFRCFPDRDGFHFTKLELFPVGTIPSRTSPMKVFQTQSEVPFDGEVLRQALAFLTPRQR